MDECPPIRDLGRRAEWVQHSLEHHVIWYAGWELDGVLRLKLGPKTHGETPDRAKAEKNMMVWCAWRVDQPSGPVAGVEECGEEIQERLLQWVQGARIDSVVIARPGWDVQIRLDNGGCLRLFCDVVGRSPVLSVNWQFRNEREILTVRANSIITVGTERER